MRLALLLPLALLAACGKPPASVDNGLDALDNALASNADDPAVAIAVNEPLMTDPALAQSANARAVRPPPRLDPGAMPPDDLGRPADTARAADLKPTPAATPGCPGCTAAKGALTLRALAERQPDRAVAGCASLVRYATAWANRLPTALPLYPDAMVAEAAGTDAHGCSLRVVSFTSAASPARVGDWFTGHGTRAGYTIGHRAGDGEDMLTGRHGPACFTLFLRPRRGGGTEADLVVNG